MRSKDFAGIPRFSPRTLVAVLVRLNRALDLTDDQILALSGLSSAALIAPWQSSVGMTDTQAFGRDAHDAGLEGILFPSALVPGARNLAVFPENLRGRSELRVVDE